MMWKRNRRVTRSSLAAVAVAFTLVSACTGQAQPSHMPGAAVGANGMMGGQNYGPGMMGGVGPGAQQAAPVASLAAAQQVFQGYIDRTGNQDLALDEVMQFQWNFYAIVKEKSTGRGAFELLADPRTGVVFPELGPNMMWNTKYSPVASYGGGMMGGMSGFTPSGMMSGGSGPTAATAQPTVTADQARQFAQQWLDQNQVGSGTETPDTFPGYYTVHITLDKTITGMLSVNAYTGQVWFHAWHGGFSASTEG